MKRMIASLLLTVLVAFGVTQNVNAAAITPIMITDGNVTQSVSGVTFSVRKDYNHPYVEYTSAYGNGYNRQLVVELTITNQTGKAFNYTAYMTATDANGLQLVNANPLAASTFGTLANGASTTIQSIFLLTKANDVSTFTLGYQHMDYSSAYLTDVNLYASGLLSAVDFASRYPQTPVVLTVNYPMQHPGVGGADRKSAIRGSITSASSSASSTSSTAATK